MSSIVFFGECMIELFQNDENLLEQTYAGDMFNSAVYLKRTFPQLEVNFATAIGRDLYSTNMLEMFYREHIGTEFVFRSETKIPGLYSIQTDPEGERSFTYWRSDSAARQVMKFIDTAVMNKLIRQKMFFFSGISLAVISPEDREKFWWLLTGLKRAGVLIVFDLNYRARLWSSPQEAKHMFETALTHCDVCLPGVDDFKQLYEFENAQQVADFCQPFSIQELIIKNGADGIYCVNDSETFQIEVEPVTKVVDSTSAGDSFNGVYLGARLCGYESRIAIELASKAAAEVIKHRGAIVPSKAFKEFVEGLAIPSIGNAPSASLRLI